MADLLFKNMKKPKDCWDCPLKTTWHTPNGLHGCCGMVPSLNFQPFQKPFDNCPLVEVPPHGDLIERSSVYKVLDDRIAFYKEAGDDYDACNMVCIEGDIVAIPTIIGASKERK